MKCFNLLLKYKYKSGGQIFQQNPNINGIPNIFNFYG